MGAGRWAALAAVLVSLVIVDRAGRVRRSDPPSACKIERPAGLWPPFFYEDYWNTYTHGGLNKDWVAHPGTIGTLKAIMLFVDFPDRPASAVTQPSPIDYRTAAGPTTSSSSRFVPWFGHGVLRALERRADADPQVVPDAEAARRSGGWATAAATRPPAERRRPGRFTAAAVKAGRRRRRLQRAMT